MDYFCKLCDKTIKRMSKYNHFKSENHISSENSIISRYIILNPSFDEVMRKYVKIYKKNMINTQFVVY